MRGKVILINLNAFEQDLVKAFIGRVHEAKLASGGMPNQRNKDPDNDPLYWKRNGFGAEFACAKMMNLMPDLRVSEFGLAPDLTMHTGHTIDVKWHHRKKGIRYLIAHKEQMKHPCDFYMLFTGLFPNFLYLGYTDPHGILLAPFGRLPHQKQDDKRGDCYYLEQTCLTEGLPMTSIKTVTTTGEIPA